MIISELKPGMSVQDIYLCKSKQILTNKNGKSYISLVLSDKTGTINAKIWEPNSSDINDFSKSSFVYIEGNVTEYNNDPQLIINLISIADENCYNEADYFPVTPYDIDNLYQYIIEFIDDIDNPDLANLLRSFFENEKFVAAFKKSSAAKMVHQAYVGGLLEHTVNVAIICNSFASMYSNVNKDLLITCALLHDIGKVKEFSPFPENDYTDEGNLLGHIYIGTQLITEHAKKLNSPKSLLVQIQHCILAHHGELEYGSPKKPAILEALILHIADDADANITRFNTLIKELPEDNIWSEKSDFILNTKVRKTII